MKKSRTRLRLSSVTANIFTFAKNNKSMIQRIQSVYLLIAAVLTGSLFFFPMAEMADMKDLYRLNWQGIFQVEADGSMQMMIP